MQGENHCLEESSTSGHHHPREIFDPVGSSAWPNKNTNLHTNILFDAKQY
jgi:hypothetical protein